MNKADAGRAAELDELSVSESTLGPEGKESDHTGKRHVGPQI